MKVSHILTRNITFAISKNEEGTQTASLDRIDSSLGYIPGNVQWIHKEINRMKMDFGQEEFLDICRKIAHKNKFERKPTKCAFSILR